MSRATFRLSTDECGRSTNFKKNFDPLKKNFGLIIFFARYAFRALHIGMISSCICMEYRVKGRTGFPDDQFFRDDVLSVFTNNCQQLHTCNQAARLSLGSRHSSSSSLIKTKQSSLMYTLLPPAWLNENKKLTLNRSTTRCLSPYYNTSFYCNITHLLRRTTSAQ